MVEGFLKDYTAGVGKCFLKFLDFWWAARFILIYIVAIH